MKKVLFAVTVVGAVIFSASYAQAAYTSPKRIVISYNAFANPTYIGGKSIVRTQFVKLENVKSLSYTLTYDYNGVKQGSVGTLTPNGKNTVQRDLFLGTCSTGVCINHTTASNIKLEVSFEYKNGYTLEKTYAVKK